MAVLSVADGVACERPGLPPTRAAAWLAAALTPILVNTPAPGSQLAWLELYRAQAYPAVYYAGASVVKLDK